MSEPNDSNLPPAIDIWIDITTGTWGEVQDLRIFRNMTDRETDLLAEMGDSSRCAYGADFGSPVVD